jgi:hypothetical protein
MAEFSKQNKQTGIFILIYFCAFAPDCVQRESGYPLQVLGFADANPVGFSLLSLAPHGPHKIA